MKNKSVPENDFFEKILTYYYCPRKEAIIMEIVLKDPQYIVAIAFAIGTLVKMLRK